MVSRPNIRFKGYTDDWEQRKLSDVAGVYDGVHQTPAYQDEGIMFLSVENIATLTSEKYISEEAYDRDYKVRPEKGDILMTRIGDVGTPNVVETSEKLAYYVSLALLKPKGIDSYFLNNAIQSSSFQHGLRERTLLTAIPMKINKDEIGKVDISYPTNNDEQRKIGESFKQLDNLIILHQRKCDDTKELKKYMLQKMFPKNVEKRPEIRFEGFTDDWEQRELTEISDIVTGTTPPTKDKDNYGGDRLFVSPADIQGNRYVDETTTTLTEKGYALGRELRGGATLFVSIGSTIGKVAQIKESATTNQQINAVIPYDEMDDDFVFTMLENEADKIRKLSATQAVPIINKTTFGETEVRFPKKDEQKRIGEYFSNLDNLITLHQRKCDELKEVKKYMLQNMFPGRD